jgi:hypothetical protein
MNSPWELDNPRLFLQSGVLGLNRPDNPLRCRDQSLQVAGHHQEPGRLLFARVAPVVTAKPRGDSRTGTLVRREELTIHSRRNWIELANVIGPGEFNLKPASFCDR